MPRDDRELELADLDARIADRAEEIACWSLTSVERGVGHDLAGLQEVLGAVRVARLALGRKP